MALVVVAGGGDVARAEEPLGTFDLPAAPVPAKRPAKLGSDPFEHADPLHFGRDTDPNDNTEHEADSSHRLAIPEGAGHVNLTGSLGVDFTGATYAAIGASGLVWGVESMAGVDLRYAGDKVALNKATISLYDPDWRWSVDAGDFQTQAGGSIRGVRLGWRNGILEPQAAIAFTDHGIVGIGALKFMPVEQLSFSAEASSEKHASASASVDLGKVRFGAQSSADFNTRAWDARAYGSFHLFEGLLDIQAESRFVNAAKGLDLELGLTTDFHFKGIVDAELAYGEKGALTGDLQHSAKVRVSVTPDTTARFSAQWATFFDDQVTRHSGSTSVIWRPTKAVQLVADAHVEIGDTLKTEEHAGVSVTPIDSKQFAAIVRFDATLPNGQMVPDLALGVDMRLPADITLRTEVTRNGASGDFTGNVNLSGTVGLAAPSRGAEIEGRVTDADGKPLKNVIVTAGNYRVVTDDDGEFDFHPLPPGEYAVDVDERTLPAEQTARGSGKTFKVGKRDTEHLDFVVKAYGKVRGLVCIDKNDDGKCGADEGSLIGLLRLGDRMTAPEETGIFAFDNVVPGHYDVRFDKDYLRKGFELVSPEVVSIDVTQRSTVEPVFVVREIKKEIKFEEL